MAHPLVRDIMALREPASIPAERPAGNGTKSWPGDRAVHVHRIVLGQLRCFEHLALELTAPESDQEGQWLVLLGENGQGKTTLLRALALALLPHKASQNHVYELSRSSKLIRDAAPSQRRDAPALRSPSGASGRARVEVDLGLQATARIALAWDADTEAVEPIASPPVAPLIVGYGCRRGSALGDREGTLDLDALHGCDTLFDEHARLASAHYWLLSAQKKQPAAFERLLSTLARVLDVDSVEVEPDTIRVTGKRIGRVPVAGLSDGYLTTLGWIVDLVARWWTYAGRDGSVLSEAFHEHMPCVVLIDEIDLHLHPRWQTRVVERLRAIFPMTTFIATTHNPLALTGLAPHEIVVLSADDDGRVVAEQATSRPDLLTGSEIYETFFGIQRTHVGKLQRYGFLAGDPYRNDDEDAEMHRLHAELRAQGIEPEWQPVAREPDEDPAP